MRASRAILSCVAAVVVALAGRTSAVAQPAAQHEKPLGPSTWWSDAHPDLFIASGDVWLFTPGRVHLTGTLLGAVSF